MAAITFTVNGQEESVDVDGTTPLLWVLRDHLDLVGTKFGCGMSLCGACTVHLDGQAVRACVTPVSAVGGRKVVTIEGLAANGKFTALQQTWCDLDVAQCGYCQAGQIMCATALLNEKPNPTDEDIDLAMSGNLCRCGAYDNYLNAVMRAAGG